MNNIIEAWQKEDIFSISEDTCVIILWPSNLSLTDFDDVAEWMDIVKRKIKRQVELNATKILTK